MSKQEDFSQDPQTKLMPGQILKAAREAQEIPVDAVSKYLHLTVPTILSIEADQYQKMPAPVYVKGYLKRYAFFLKISPEAVLSAFEQNVKIKSKVVEEAPRYIQKKPMTSSHIGIRLLSFGIGLLLFVLLGLWWNEHQKNPPAKLTETNLKTPAHPALIQPITEPEKKSLPTQNPEEATMPKIEKKEASTPRKNSKRMKKYTPESTEEAAYETTESESSSMKKSENNKLNHQNMDKSAIKKVTKRINTEF